MSIRELPPLLAKKAREELYEVPERIQSDLETIKDWLTKQPHLKTRTDDQWLISFLRGCKYSLERTKEKLDLFYTMKTAVPELTMCVDPMEPTVQEILKAGVILPLLKSTNPDDPRVIIIRPGVIDPTKIPIVNLLSLNFMFMNMQLLNDDRTVVSGQIYIIDMTNLGLNHFTQMTPSLMKKMIMSRQNAMPLREKGTHHINVPSAAEKIINFGRMLMTEKNRKRFHVHGKDLDSLYDFVPKSILPEEYGGEGDSIQSIIDYWKVKFEEHRNWFIEDRAYKSDESKRPGAPKTVETLFGIEGSFRQLNVD